MQITAADEWNSFVIFKFSVNRDRGLCVCVCVRLLLCVWGTDGMSQGVLVTYLDVKPAHMFCFLLPSLRLLSLSSSSLEHLRAKFKMLLLVSTGEITYSSRAACALSFIPLTMLLWSRLSRQVDLYTVPGLGSRRACCTSTRCDTYVHKYTHTHTHTHSLCLSCSCMNYATLQWLQSASSRSAAVVFVCARVVLAPCSSWLPALSGWHFNGCAAARTELSLCPLLPS